MSREELIEPGAPPIMVVGPPCAGTRRVAGLLRAAWPAAARSIAGSARLALNVAALSARAPDARFVYVHREPADTLSEALAVWRAGTERRRPQPPGWNGPPWSFALVPGWEQLHGRTLPEVVIEQWLSTMRELARNLELLPADRWCVTDFARMVSHPAVELRRLGAFLELPGAAEPGSAPVGSEAPANRPVPAELVPYLHRTHELAARAGGWFA